jgi:pimeloyl-ACP methyl ester carboxylesterase
MATAGKILFPIPSRRVAKRLYRVTADTLVLWESRMRSCRPCTGERWIQLIAGARLAQIDNAGHMVPYEQPKSFASLVASFLD